MQERGVYFTTVTLAKMKWVLGIQKINNGFPTSYFVKKMMQLQSFCDVMPASESGKTVASVVLALCPLATTKKKCWLKEMHYLTIRITDPRKGGFLVGWRGEVGV